MDEQGLTGTLFATAHDFVPTDDEVAAVLQRHQRRHAARARLQRSLLVLLAGMVVACGSAYAIPPVRAAVDDVAGQVSSWLTPDTPTAPQAPEWVSENGGRLIAEADGVGLYVTRRDLPGGRTMLDFALGEGAGLGDTVDGWRERFADQAVVVLGPALRRSGSYVEDGRYPLLGVTAKSVESIEARYSSGRTARFDARNGGFVALIDVERELRELVAVGTEGEPIARIPAPDLRISDRVR